MTFRPRNAYYLRISANGVLPLYLYIDERHIDWMSDTVLQHVLADLRPLIIPKLQAEKDVHFSPGAAPGNKRGSVEVHRGETYQFAYFFRKTEPQTVLLKSRYFVAASAPSDVPPKPNPQRPVDKNPEKKRPGTQASTKQSKRKRVKTNIGKKEISLSDFDEDEWSTGGSGSENGMDDPDPVPREPRPVRKQRRIVTDACQEDDEEDMHQDVSMGFPETDDGTFGDSAVLVRGDGDVATHNGNGQPRRSPDMVDIELVVEEEEEKPKPLLKLKYQSFTITGHCLCVVIEPWPLQRAETRLQSVGLGVSVQRGTLEPPLPPSSESVIGRRAKTPLFFPECDREPREAPFARERILPLVPLFHDAVSSTGDNGYSDDDLMNFSQALNATGHMHALTADDDDDMDGAALFGDADEVRELF